MLFRAVHLHKILSVIKTTTYRKECLGTLKFFVDVWTMEYMLCLKFMFFHIFETSISIYSHICNLLLTSVGETLFGTEDSDDEDIWTVFLLSPCSTPSAHHCFSPLPSNRYARAPNT